MRSPSTDTVGAPLSAAPAGRCRERQPGGASAVGGLRMSRLPFSHRPVMEAEVVAALEPVPAGVLVDATVGGGGHSAALLAARPDLLLVGLDRDEEALAAAAERLGVFGDRVRLVHCRFDAIASVVGNVTVSAVLFDLGVSSPQLDRADRGFSYRQPGPLDMRMDRSQSLTAAHVVNTYPTDRLAAMFRASGESRFSHRVARAIVAARPIDDTLTLASVVRDAIPAPARRRGGHPAKRVFQAIRIEVNGELEALARGLEDALELLAVGGRVAVLSYHSGEDRLTKSTFVAAATGGCTCPPGMPCVCGATPRYRLVFRGSRTPTGAELAGNPRAESARLRVIERVAA